MFTQKVDQLLSADHGYGHSIWCWLRRRARAHHEIVHGSELEGSSDVSNHLFTLWNQWRGKRPGTINDGLGFYINAEICLHMDIPNTKATREYHNCERA